jgi:hypothetical protein
METRTFISIQEGADIGNGFGRTRAAAFEMVSKKYSLVSSCPVKTFCIVMIFRKLFREKGNKFSQKYGNNRRS